MPLQSMKAFGSIRRYARPLVYSTKLGERLMALRGARKVTRTARKEASSLAASFLAEPGKRLRVTYDNTYSPPTYGDLFQVLMLTRFLAINGRDTEFVLLDDGSRRSDWGALNAAAQEEFVAEQIALAQSLLPSHVAIKKVGHGGAHSELSKNDDVHEVLGEPVAAGVPLYILSPSLLDQCYRDPHFDQRSSFLLEDATRTHQQFSTVDGLGPYVAWHIRKGLWSEERDSNQASIVQDFLELREIFPAHSLMIFSSSPGVDFALAVLEQIGAVDNMSAQGLRLLGQPSPGFVNAIPLILQSDFYFQRLGGGVGMVPIFSSVPYLILSGDGNYYYGRKGNRLVPWASKDQMFVVDPYRVRELRVRSYVEVPRVKL